MPRRFADVTDRFDQPGSNRAKALLAVERLPECRSVGKAFLFEQLAASPAGNPARWRQPFHEAWPGQQPVGQCRPFAHLVIGDRPCNLHRIVPSPAPPPAHPAHLPPPHPPSPTPPPPPP